MLAVYTELKNAQKVKEFLLKRKVLNHDYLPIKELDHLYFPILRTIKVPSAKVVNTKFSFQEKSKPLTIKEVLAKKLGKKELSLLPHSQETVGRILILEMPLALQKKEKIIAEEYLKLNSHVETVVKKQDIHSGVYRTRKVKVLAGKRSKETIHLENGIKVKLHLERTYFSARLGAERLRIANQIKKPEDVLVMFSGAAPYPLVIARNSPASKIFGVEMNPLAHRYALDNIDLNKFGEKIKIIQGNVRTVVPKIKKKFDRIAMPLPKTGEEFLDVSLPKLKSGGIVHLYAFLHEDQINKEARKIRQKCAQLKYPVRVLRKIQCGQFSPGTYRICFDLKLKK